LTSDYRFWLIKIAIAVPGAIVWWQTYQAVKRRRLDPSATPDPVTDRWWRIGFYSLTAVLADLVIILVASAAGAPHWIGILLFTILAGGTLVTFAAAFMLGVRHGLS
jgi:hypothetical protein